MHDPSTYVPDRSLFAKITRRLTQYRQAAPAMLNLDQPVLSLTFDDCPLSAIQEGTRVLDQHNVKGGFYIATGLLGDDSPMGEMAHAEDVKSLQSSGHEIGAHSHAHIDYARADLAEIERDIETNLEKLRQILGQYEVESFAFPYGETSFAAKQSLAGRFTNLRGLLPGINRGQVDRAQLRAYELDGRPNCVDAVLQGLEDMTSNPGWMIVFTHDVGDEPSPLGTTPEVLDRIITRAKDLNIRVEPPANAARIAGIAV